jgi:hypothetical protein
MRYENGLSGIGLLVFAIGMSEAQMPAPSTKDNGEASVSHTAILEGVVHRVNTDEFSAEDSLIFEIWFPSKNEHRRTRAFCRIQLDDVVDDLGNHLLTKARRDQLPGGNKMFLLNRFGQGPEGGGPSVELRTDMPPKEAKFVVSLKGKVKLFNVEHEEIKVPLKLLDNKPIKHTFLGDAALVPSVKQEERQTVVSIMMDERDEHRIVDFAVKNGRKTLKDIAHDLDRANGKVTKSLTFARKLPSANELVIHAVRPTSEVEVAFHFKNIPIPREINDPIYLPLKK